MKRMLINAAQSEELRVALVDGQHLYDLDIENAMRESRKANIYKGRITRIEPSLEAAFVDYGAERHGFLPLKDVARECYRQKVSGKPRIHEVLEEGQQVLVQVDKEERGTKGAALTTFLSLAGRHLVLMPNNARAGGISRRIEGEEREELRAAMKDLEPPHGMGLIARTAAVGRTAEELQWDLEYLTTLNEAIQKAASEREAPFLVLRESDVILRTIRDNLRPDIGEILVDDPDALEKAKGFVQQVMPRFVNKVKLYDDPVPLFTRYQVENQIETAFQHEVKLPSGGSLVIDPTEALVSVDVNSSRATKGSDIEETALTSNLEAADELARQMRLRDIGGLIVIDFIDMSQTKHQREVESRLREALKLDRARVQVGRISRFGLLEMSRQRLRPSLEESTATQCPRCNGRGVIRDIKSLALALIRLIEEEAHKPRTSQVRAIVPVSVATFLLNEKRAAIRDIEQCHNVHVVVVPNPHMDTPAYEVIRLRDDSEALSDKGHSFDLVSDPEPPENLLPERPPARREEAAVKVVARKPPVASEPKSADPEPAPEAEDASAWQKMKRSFTRLFAADEDESSSKPVSEALPEIITRKPADKAKQPAQRKMAQGNKDGDRNGARADNRSRPAGERSRNRNARSNVAADNKPVEGRQEQPQNRERKKPQKQQKPQPKDNSTAQSAERAAPKSAAAESASHAAEAVPRRPRNTDRRRSNRPTQRQPQENASSERAESAVQLQQPELTKPVAVQPESRLPALPETASPAIETASAQKAPVAPVAETPEKSPEPIASTENQLVEATAQDKVESTAVKPAGRAAVNRHPARRRRRAVNDPRLKRPHTETVAEQRSAPEDKQD
jgi:ribonuclease E